MKKTGLLIALFFQMTAMQAAKADLVVYTEDAESNLYSVEPSKEGVAMIVSRSCPKDKWIESVSECRPNAREHIAVSDFRSFTYFVLKNWATKNPKADLSPLKAAELAQIDALIGFASVAAEYDKVTTEMASVDEMLSHLPNSSVYLQRKADLSQRTDTLRLKFSAVKQIKESVDGLSDSVLLLIAKNNPDTKKLNYFARSQMQGKLLGALMDSLFLSFGGDREVLEYAANNPGKRGRLVMRMGNIRNRLYYDGVEKGEFLDAIPEQCAPFAKQIRDYILSDQW